MSLIGCVDTLWDTRISGWAADDADRAKAVQVDVAVNSQVVATVPCATFREDLLAAGIGDGCKAFYFDPTAHLKPGRNNLEVYYAGSRLVVPRGRAHWVRRRAGGISEWEASFLAALEAHYEFNPEHHVCGIGEGAAELEQVLVKAGAPFRKFTSMKVPADFAAVRLAEKADLVISWAWPKPAPEGVRVLERLALHHMNKPGFLAIGFADTPEAVGQIRQALRECGAREAKLESVLPALGGVHRIFVFAETRGTEATPVLAHIHVPKCAGTSFRALLERYFGPGHLTLYVDDTYFVYGDEALRSYLVQDPTIQGFSSHHVRMFPHWLAGREMLYVTFLRDPIQQFVSYMTHIKKHYAGITSQSLLEAVPPDAPRLTLREFARWLLTQDRDIPFRENHNVNFFARHSSPMAVDRLEAAKSALERFFFVGITERMEESIAKLRKLVRTVGLDFPPDPVLIENTSSEFRDDVSWINPDDEVGLLLLRSVEKDRQLYEWAAARLERVVRESAEL
ncbi:MAG: sulfotransferase family 2 domain-containing protein [Bryobacteraceae bacterium]